MNFLPIVERELTVRAKQSGARWLRWFFLLLGVLMVCLMLMSMSGAGQTKEAGRGVYSLLVQIVFLSACAASLLTADCVGSERRGGTLGLLFLTDLKAYDVALGKLAAVGIDALYALIGFTPLLALPLLAGGVTGSEVARAAVALFNTLFVSLAVGLFVSTRNGQQTRAMRATVFWVVGLMLVPVLVGLVLKPRMFFTPALVSPGYAFVASSASNYLAAPSRFWGSLALAHSEGWLFLALASWTLTRNWREEAETYDLPATRKVEDQMEATDLTQDKPRLASQSFGPVGCLVLRLRGQRALVWTATALVCLGTNGLLMRVVNLWPRSSFGISAVYGMWGFSMFSSFAATALFAWAASRFFLDSRSNGTLEMLLTTPLGAQEIISDQWRVMGRLLRLPLCFMVLVYLLSSVQIFSLFIFNNSVGLLAWRMIMVLVQAGNVALEVLALCWIAMWFGLRAHKPTAAVAWAVGVIQAAPWIVSYLISILLSTSGWIRSSGSGPSPTMVIWYTVMPVLMTAFYLSVISWAQTRLARALPAATALTFAGALHRLPGRIRTTIRRTRHWTPADSP